MLSNSEGIVRNRGEKLKDCNYSLDLSNSVHWSLILASDKLRMRTVDFVLYLGITSGKDLLLASMNRRNNYKNCFNAHISTWLLLFNDGCIQCNACIRPLIMCMTDTDMALECSRAIFNVISSSCAIPPMTGLNVFCVKGLKFLPATPLPTHFKLTARLFWQIDDRSACSISSSLFTWNYVAVNCRVKVA